ncbi:hypothetical protein OHA79_28355 [Streptomyces sp. NBC_00841]|uniref:hypothetical protein n=1 Tax=unclassified Streptomyces TaxID=2593676 RepID=UPI00225692C3|nr:MULTISPECIES: hypothetical protein [unclassified Streptomyces]MCX4533155.1 hypothetical protein [Streptomyces sp. NBC_01669]WSA01408.1 hypothetical protein OHA79_28355 [Streptomyces sp. NBC_00841]
MRKPGGRLAEEQPGVRSTRRPVGCFRFLRRLAVSAAAVCGLSLCLAPGAVAGGPTTVLVASPDSGKATALSVSDPRYTRLEALLGPAGEGDKERPQSLDGAVGTRQINVTWMVHDLEPMRTDRVFPGDDPDTVWIHTASEVPYTYRGYWHRAKKPAELVALFKQLGLLGKKSSEEAYAALFPQPWEDSGQSAPLGRAAGPAPAPWPAASASAAPAAARAVGSSDRFNGVWWAVPGLVAGAALALALRPLAARRGGGGGGGRYGRETGPRQELLDL